MADAIARLMVVAAAALVDGDGRILVQRRPAGKMLAGLWEFPGGKLEPGEAPDAALVRELKEELGIEVAADQPRPIAFSTGHAGDRPLLLLLYCVTAWRGRPAPIEGAELRWVEAAELNALAMPAADRPLVAALLAALARPAGLTPA